MMDITNIVSSVVVSSGVVFLLRSWISERLKNSIQHEYTEKMERLRTELRSASEKEIIQF